MSTFCNDAQENILLKIINSIRLVRFFISLTINGSDKNDTFFKDAIHKLFRL